MTSQLPPPDNGEPRNGFASHAGAGQQIRAPFLELRPRTPRRTLHRAYWLWGGGAVAALLVWMLARNGVHSAFAVLALVAVVSLCYRRDEPPALLYAGIYQWLQASMLLFVSDLRGDALFDRALGPETIRATYLTLIGVVCFSIGSRVGAGRSPLVARTMVDQSLRALSMSRLTIAWVMSVGVATTVSAVATKVPAVYQMALAVAQIRWVLVLLLAAWVVRANKGYGMLAGVVLFEAVYGLMGFFSAFKSVFVVAGIGMLFVAWSTPRKVNTVLVAFVPIVLLLGVYWTSMKEDYRSFLNEGTRQQVVLVTPQQQIAELVELAGSQTREDLTDAAERMLERIGYVSFFAAAINYVPNVVPYQDGALWLKSVWHVLVPRMVDPDKPALDDSERTSEFTGMRVAGVAQGTSIGLGYVAESYIDFGPVLMFAPIFLWGLLVGAGYRLLARSPAPLLGLGCGAVLVVFGASLVEMSNTKMLGGLITVLVVFALVLRFLGPQAMRALSKPENRQ
jgi:hypothetical protein